MSRRSRSRRRRPFWRGLSSLLVVAPLAAFTAVFLWDGGPPGRAFDFDFRSGPRPTAQDRERARFVRCSGRDRFNCVVDGDTFWYRGEKIRLSGINAPEVSKPGCAREAELGEKATRRLQALLNAGPFTLESGSPGDNRDRDRYGRLLRDATRDGASLGDTLRAEGLAERWKGRRGNWC